MNMPSWQDYKYGVEYLFTSLLAKSKFRTMVGDWCGLEVELHELFCDFMTGS